MFKTEWDFYKEQAMASEPDESGEVAAFVGNPLRLSLPQIQRLQEEARAHRARFVIQEKGAMVVFNAAQLYVELNFPKYRSMASAAIADQFGDVHVQLGPRSGFPAGVLRFLSRKAREEGSVLTFRDKQAVLVFPPARPKRSS